MSFNKNCYDRLKIIILSDIVLIITSIVFLNEE